MGEGVGAYANGSDMAGEGVGAYASGAGAVWWARAGAYKRADVGGAHGVRASERMRAGREAHGVRV